MTTRERTDAGAGPPEPPDLEALGEEIVEMVEYIRTREREYAEKLDEYERLHRKLGDAAPPRRHFREPDEDFL